MNVNWIKTSLQELKRTFGRILDDSAEYVIGDAIAGLEISKSNFDERIKRTDDPRLTPRPWGYRIDPDRPLIFKQSKAMKGLDLWADLSCKVLWEKEGAMPIEQDVCLRVWSNILNNCTYREDWDSNDVLNKLTHKTWPNRGRVMLRCHFDLANPNQPGPKYHIQFGGKAREDELCWFPEVINLPRLFFPPMDLILTCQLVAANFYWEEYNEFREDPQWINTLHRSQGHLLKDYYKDCFNVLKQDHLLLDHLWNN